MSAQNRLRPLLIAEAANPEWTSVPLVGWSLAKAIRERTDALIVTQVRNRDAFIRAGLRPEKDFVAIDNEHVARRFYQLSSFLRGGENKGWTMVTAFSSLSYYSFESQVWRLLKHRLLAGEFSLVHRITPLSPTSQSLLANRLARHRIPFVLGPLNGGVPWPEGFGHVQRREREWLSSVRQLYRMMPAYRATRLKASALIAGSRHTLDELPATCASRAFLVPENAVDPARFPLQMRQDTAGPLRLAFIGRLVPYKGLDVLIEAISSELKARRMVLTVVGDGPERPRIERMVAERGLKSAVHFAGWTPHAAVAETLKECQVLALPSIREFGGGVVLEAMSMGLVPVVANYGGPPELLDASSGVVVDFSNRESLVSGFRRALIGLAQDPVRLARLGEGAAARVRRFYTWDAKAEQMIEIYRWALGQATKPRLFEGHETVPLFVS